MELPNRAKTNCTTKTRTKTKSDFNREAPRNQDGKFYSGFKMRNITFKHDITDNYNFPRILKGKQNFHQIEIKWAREEKWEFYGINCDTFFNCLKGSTKGGK